MSTADRQPAGTPPNLVPGPHFPSLNNNLAHSGAEKKKAAKYIEEHLGPGTRKAGIIADEASELVAGNPKERGVFNLVIMSTAENNYNNGIGASRGSTGKAP